MPEERTDWQPVFVGALTAHRNLSGDLGIQVVTTPVCITSFAKLEEAREWGTSWCKTQYPPRDGWQDHEAVIEQADNVVAVADVAAMIEEARRQSAADWQGQD